VIENTLSLSSDQCSKIKSASQAFGAITAIQLDTINDSSSVEAITK